MAEADGVEHDVFRQLQRFRFDHQHAVAGAGDDQVEVALVHPVDVGIELELPV